MFPTKVQSIAVPSCARRSKLATQVPRGNPTKVFCYATPRGECGDEIAANLTGGLVNTHNAAHILYVGFFCNDDSDGNDDDGDDGNGKGAEDDDDDGYGCG